MEFTRKEQFDAYVDLILAARQKGTVKAAEEAERRKTAIAPKNKKKSARKAAALEWARKSLDAERAKDGSSFKPKTVTEEDVAAAAVYRAKGEEAHRNQDRKGELDAVIKWIGTGDPEAIRISNQWVDENMAAMKLQALDPTEYWEAVDARRHRESGESLWVDSCGSSPTQPMCHTDDKPPRGRGTAFPMRTLQVFSVRVGAITGGLDWPLDVYGVVAARDSFDQNHNIIFNRTRDNCQTIDKKNPCLRLTGPTRAVVVVDPASFEVNLRVKGRTESEDRELSNLVFYYHDSGSSESYAIKRVSTSKLSTVTLMLGDIVNSVEATISVRVVGGEWPEGFQGLISVNTASIDAKKVELLAFGDKLPLAADGMIQLSRHVVSVEANGELIVSVMATSLEDQTVERDSEAFRAKKASRSMRMLEVHRCKFEVTVACSCPEPTSFPQTYK
ncbi:hypothetical protein CFC21_005251 [Triticum aestivum]|uniref:DUF6598 domain-containing protein n=2 Tax=Triticum aestivum TaxID=4565 RepID=A0A3B5YRK5_WHEAT|nr:uncharacterized protein LOC123086278 [Triticum aestivum]KAF6987629.1 hypothetical protein CFC21_005251 [Triticum aestivum]